MAPLPLSWRVWCAWTCGHFMEALKALHVAPALQLWFTWVHLSCEVWLPVIQMDQLKCKENNWFSQVTHKSNTGNAGIQIQIIWLDVTGSFSRHQTVGINNYSCVSHLSYAVCFILLNHYPASWEMRDYTIKANLLIRTCHVKSWGG